MMLAGLIALIVMLGGFAVLHWLERRREVRDAARHERFMQTWAAEVEPWIQDQEQFAQEVAVLLRLSWRELRRLCEEENGRPCECSTRGQAARRIHCKRLFKKHGQPERVPNEIGYYPWPPMPHLPRPIQERDR